MSQENVEIVRRAIEAFAAGEVARQLGVGFVAMREEHKGTRRTKRHGEGLP
jgi:adenine/guanine phosphoribosyltransferase-like PRPP-binding protein